MNNQGVPRIEPAFQRLRAWLDGELILDSRDAYLSFENVHHPLWAVRRAQLRVELEAMPGADSGDGSLLSLVTSSGHRRAGAAHRAMGVDQPAPRDVQLDDVLVLHPEAADLWLEEDQPTSGSPRNPYHRVDVFPSSRTVRIVGGGKVIAETGRPVLLLETGLVPRWYIPAGDVAWGRLVGETTMTSCPYKGLASYWRITDSDARLWSYQHPDPAVAAIAGMLAADGLSPDVEIYVDGERESTVEPQSSSMFR